MISHLMTTDSFPHVNLTNTNSYDDHQENKSSFNYEGS